MTSKVLFITIPFYEYIDHITEAIKQNIGAQVDVFICDQPLQGISYWKNKIQKKDVEAEYKARIQKSYFTGIQNIEYDYIFVLVGRGLNRQIFEEFMKRQRKAKKILYLWDDVQRIIEFEWISKLFNNIYSFDQEDCKRFGLNFLPLFYCNPYQYCQEKKVFDFSFTGFLHTDRERILADFLKIFPNDKYDWYVSLKTTRKHEIWKKIRNISYKTPWYIKFKTLRIAENADILKRSKTVIDMPHEGQNGLSIRTLESLASHTKLITTNRNVVDYDFYNENNIQIVDRNNIVIDPEFMLTEYSQIDERIVANYSINSWVNSLFRRK